MDKVTKVKATCMMFIVLIMMVHNGFPHIHHHHVPDSASGPAVNTHHHHHDLALRHENEHGNAEKNEPGVKVELDFLKFLLRSHVHSTHEHLFIPVSVEGITSGKPGVHHSVDGVGLSPYEVKNEENYLHRYHVFKKVAQDKPDLLSNPLRGPPSWVNQIS